jgi:hypothetical protein
MSAPSPHIRAPIVPCSVAERVFRQGSTGPIVRGCRGSTSHPASRWQFIETGVASWTPAARACLEVSVATDKSSRRTPRSGAPQPGEKCDGELCVTMTTILEDLSRRSSRVNRETGNRVCQMEPGEPAFMPAFEPRVVGRSSPHQSGADRGDTDSLACELGVKTFR